jgi:hypothetical protein
MIKPDKSKSTEKIDGISAAVVAFAMAIGADEELAGSGADDWKVHVL